MKLANGTVLALMATIGPDNLRQLLSTPALPPGWLAIIVDTHCVIIARSVNPDKFVGQKIRAELWRRMQRVPQDAADAVTLEAIPVSTAFNRSSVTN